MNTDAEKQTLGTVASINRIIVALRPRNLILSSTIDIVKLKGLSSSVKELHAILKPVAYTGARRNLNAAAIAMRDLHHALSTNAPITSEQIAAEREAIQQQLRTARDIYREEKQQIMPLPQGRQLIEANEDEAIVLVQNMYERMRKVPKTLPGKRAFILVDKVPVVAIGLFGTVLDAVSRFFRVVPYISGYAVIDNQQVLAIDLERAKKSVTEVGHTFKSRDARDQALEIATELLKSYNEKTSAPLTLMTETATTWGKLIYFWVAPTKVYNRLSLSHKFRVGGDGDNANWGFPSNLDVLTKQNNTTDAEIDKIFKLALEYAAQPKEFSAVFTKELRAPSVAQLRAKGVPPEVEIVQDPKTKEWVAHLPTKVYGRNPKELYDQGAPNTAKISHDVKQGARKRNVDFLRIAELTGSDSKFVQLLITGKMQAERTREWRDKYNKLINSNSR